MTGLRNGIRLCGTKLIAVIKEVPGLVFLIISSIIMVVVLSYKPPEVWSGTVVIEDVATDIELIEPEDQEELLLEYKVDEWIINHYTGSATIQVLKAFGTNTIRNYEVYATDTAAAEEFANYVALVWSTYPMKSELNIFVINTEDRELVDYYITKDCSL